MVKSDFIDNCKKVVEEVREFCSNVGKGIGADYISEHFEEEHDFKKIVFPAGVMLSLVVFVTGFLYGWYDDTFVAAIQKGTRLMIDCFVKFVLYYFASLFVFENLVCRWRFKLDDANRKAKAFTVFVMLVYFAVESVVAVLPFLDVLRFVALYIVYLAYCVADDYFGVQEKKVVVFLVWLVAVYYFVLKVAGMVVGSAYKVDDLIDNLSKI